MVRPAKRKGKGAPAAAGRKRKANEHAFFEEEDVGFFDQPGNEGRAESESEEEEAEETAEQKRLRLARAYLDRLATGREEEEEEGGEGGGGGGVLDRDAVTGRLRQEALESLGHYQRRLAHRLALPPLPRAEEYQRPGAAAAEAAGAEAGGEPTLPAPRFLRVHRLPVTAVALSPDDRTCYSVSKDGGIIRCDVETGKRTALQRGGGGDAGGGAAQRSGGAEWVAAPAARAPGAALLAAAVSGDGRYLAAGGGDRKVHLWDARSGAYIRAFPGHKDAITALAFREGTQTLYSGSLDRSVKIWSVDDMAYVDTLFGHQAEVLGIDAARAERVVTCGADRTCRIPEESQLIFRGHCNTIECCRYVTGSEWVTGSADGSLQLWSSTKKKAVHDLRGAHFDPADVAGARGAGSVGGDAATWVGAMAVCKGSDLVASGAGDGIIRLWRVGEGAKGGASKALHPLGGLPARGFVNGLALACSGRLLVAGLGQEPRMGRWLRDGAARNGLLIQPLALAPVGLGNPFRDAGTVWRSAGMRGSSLSAGQERTGGGALAALEQLPPLPPPLPARRRAAPPPPPCALQRLIAAADALLSDFGRAGEAAARVLAPLVSTALAELRAQQAEEGGGGAAAGGGGAAAAAGARARAPPSGAPAAPRRDGPAAMLPCLERALAGWGWSEAAGAFGRPVDARALSSRLKVLLFGGLRQQGSGTYSCVYRCTHRLTGETLTLKKLRLPLAEEGIATTTLREVSLLHELAGCPHIVRLLDVLWDGDRLYLVLESLDRDLREHLDRDPAASALPNVKRYMYQLLRGMAYAHARRVLHRDLKPQNVLVEVATGRLRIADFGLARAFTPPLRPFTHNVVTLLYRAPEVGGCVRARILLGAPIYSAAVDVWSLGCILGELATGEPLFQGDSEIGQLYHIFQVLGTPQDDAWPGVSRLPDWQPTFPAWRRRELAEVVPQLDAPGLDLLSRMLEYDPSRRIRCRDALQHPWFDDVRESEERAAAAAAATAAGPAAAAAVVGVCRPRDPSEAAADLCTARRRTMAAAAAGTPGGAAGRGEGGAPRAPRRPSPRAAALASLGAPALRAGADAPHERPPLAAITPEGCPAQPWA
eukprot:scaffold19.g1865.t1